MVSLGLALITIHILWPITNINSGVKVKTSRARHQDWSEINTFIVETAVIGMRYKDSIAIFTLMADDIKINRSLDS